MDGRFFCTRGWSGVDEFPRDELDGVLHFVATSAFVAASRVGGSLVIREDGIYYHDICGHSSEMEEVVRNCNDIPDFDYKSPLLDLLYGVVSFVSFILWSSFM